MTRKSQRPSATGSHEAISTEELMHLRFVANGSKPASLILRHGSVLSSFTGEFLPRDVVISGRHIAAITPWDHFRPTAGVEEIDVKGKHVVPEFIDAHIHIEYTKLVSGELARLSVPRGTTTVLADANCIANVLGERGLDFMGQTTTPLRIFRQVSHRVPRSGSDLELGGAKLETAEVSRRVALPEAATLGESNPFSLDLASAEKQSAALQAGKRITGHTALLKNEPLWAYAVGGIGDDHNAHKTEDVVERLRLGLMLTVMSGSMNSNIESVFSDIEALKDGLTHISFCADDKLVEDIDRTGHIDRHVREAIALGIPAVKAYRMATLNPALYYRIDHLVGSISPGRLADILTIDQLEEVRPETVIVNGVVVARDNTALFANTDKIPDFTLNTIHLHPSFFSAAKYAVNVGNKTYAWVQAMEMYDGYFKRAFHARLSSDASGNLLCNLDLDILKVVVIDRHHGSKNRGIGFNLVVIGTNDDEIAFAARAIDSLGGGYVTVADGKVLASVKLDVAGCMSSAKWEDVRDQSLLCDEAARSLGCGIQAPFLIASFVGLNGVPDLGLTEKGLIDCQAQELINVVLSEEVVGDVGSLAEYPVSAPVKRVNEHRIISS
ncbi:adenine deaminase [Stipitochalara longipes BDJ]|nr:adenine deaminase [Stipitochalara longipes BDJ]